MANAANTTPSKCFSGILRRLICSGSLPTHPSDDKFVELNTEQKPEEYSMEHRAAKMKVEAASTPGVVARLMGLDSFPSSPFSAPKEKTTLGSFFRSRSVNSIDFLSHFDPIIIKQGRPHHHHHHRRVRTSVSFREGINDNFSSNVIPRLEDTAEVEQPELVITRKTNPDINYYQHSKIAKGDRIRNREKLQEKRVANKPSKEVENMNQKKSSQKMDFHAKSTRHGLKKEGRQNVISNEEMTKNSKGLKTKKKMVLSHEKVQSGCRMKRVHPQATVVPPEVCSRNNAASKIVKSERIPCSSGGAHSAHNGEIRAITKGKNERKMKSKESCYYKRMAEQICRLADEDVKENNWMDGCALEFDDFEDMCHHFGQEILQVLLQQFVDELVILYHTWENN